MKNKWTYLSTFGIFVIFLFLTGCSNIGTASYNDCMATCQYNNDHTCNLAVNTLDNSDDDRTVRCRGDAEYTACEDQCK